MDLPQATALVSSSQLIGGFLGIAIYGTIFANELAKLLVTEAPTAPFELVRHSVSAIFDLPPDVRVGVVHAYVQVRSIRPFHPDRKLICHVSLYGSA